MEEFICEKCDCTVEIEGACRDCGYVFPRTFQEWVDQRIEIINQRGGSTFEEELAMQGFSIVDLEDYEYDEEEE